MFSSPPTLKKLSTMSPEGKVVLANTLAIYENNGIGSAAMCEQITMLGCLNLWTLYMLSENNAFVHAILENNEYLKNVWSKLLRKVGYPDCEFISSDKKIKVSLFSQLKGAVLLSALKTHEDKRDQRALEILNKACDLGLYSALMDRLNFYSEYIIEHMNNKNDRETVETYVQFILRDINKLCNLYGAMAHLDSAFILFNLAENYLKQEEQKVHTNYFFMPAAANKFSWIDKYNAKDCPLPVMLFASAIEHLYLAEMLEQDPLSKNACDKLLQGKGLLAGFEDKYTDAKALEKTVKTKLTQHGIPLVDTFCEMSLDAAKISLKKK